MKKILFLLILALGLTSCSSRNDKIKNIVTEDLRKIIIDIESYDPIEMKIDSAFASAHTDSAAVKYAIEIEKGVSKLKEISKDLDMKMEYLRISYSPERYKEIQSLEKEMKAIIDKNNELSMKIYERSKQIGNEFIGYKVSHSFRCRTSGGNMVIGNVLYIVDKNVKNILFKKIIDEEEMSYDRHIGLAIKSKGRAWDFQDK